MDKVINLIKKKLGTDHVTQISDSEIMTLGVKFEVFWKKENIVSPKKLIIVPYKVMSKISPDRKLLELSKLLDNIRSHMDRKESYFSGDKESVEEWILT